MKALIFDLDGTLVDSVYPHTLAWQKALADFGMTSPAWAVHRRIGMSGQLLVRAIAREQHRRLSQSDIRRLAGRHAQLFRTLAPVVIPLPGAVELLAYLRKLKIPHGIATSGKRAEIKSALKALSLSKATVVVDGDMVEEVKPEPDLFLACQRELKVERADCLVVGDAVWDIYAARRAGITSIGLLTGGYGEQELHNAGAMRVYRDADTLRRGMDELGFE